MSAALEIHGLSRSFGALEVARAIDLVLDRGARHALIGPNGAGKTTFVNLVTGVLDPSAGRIVLGGRDVTAWSQAERSRGGLARTFQINQLFRALSVVDNVCLSVAEHAGVAARMFRPLGRHDEIVDRAIAILERVHLVEQALRPVGELPYGQQRLVEIAVALGQSPTVLLLDEPAAGVPSSEHRIILDVIDGLGDDLAVLVIEHDMDVVFRVANRISVLVSGAVLVEGSPEEVAADERVRSVYLGGSGG